MNALASVETLVVSQKKEWGEILSGFETRNRYVILSEVGDELYFAAEEKGSLLLRLFLKAFRPFTIVVTRTDGNVVLRLERPFRFFFHKMDVRDAHGKLLGTVEREFSVVRRLYRVFDATGTASCTAPCFARGRFRSGSSLVALSGSQERSARNGAAP